MVMEDSTYPNAQIVGREFVRQYYTLLHEAPKYLHRFYSSNSSFIHGGVDKPGQEAQIVYGQTEIHKRITDLNFKDCHAKIRQVDSQPTVSSAVVVQVTGELSNNGGPLRRFMQTFVLAPQNPKQYYVHNDIFRYQDEVFQDYESDEDDVETEQQVEHEHQNGVVDGHNNYQPDEEQQFEEEEKNEPEPTPVQQPPAPTRQSPAPTSPPADDKDQIPAPHHTDEKKPELNQQPETEQATVTTEKGKPKQPAQKEAEPVARTEPPSLKPSSWANVVNKSAGTSTSAAAVAVVNPMTTSNQIQQQQSSQQQQPQSLAAVSTQQQIEDSTTSVSEDKPPTQPSNQPRGNRGPNEPGRRPVRSDEPYGERRNERFPDAQQVFVGNLPSDIAELELRKFFGQYGKVIECRINRGQPDKKVPFGFVVFESEEPVKQLLAMKRVEMNGHRLNVEEKKARGERNASSGRDRPPRGPRVARANSRPKDRDNSNPRMDNNRPSPQSGAPQQQSQGKKNYGNNPSNQQRRMQ